MVRLPRFGTLLRSCAAKASRAVAQFDQRLSNSNGTGNTSVSPNFVMCALAQSSEFGAKVSGVFASIAKNRVRTTALTLLATRIGQAH